MICRFTHIATAVDDLQASCTWRTPAGGEAGEASVFVPVTSRAYGSQYIDPEGGSMLAIESDNGGGVWSGIVTQLVFTDGGVTITAHQPWLVLGRRHVRGNLTVTNMPASWIAYTALQDAVAGLPFSLASDPWNDGGPIIGEFSFSRQDAWSIVSEMMDAGSGELHVDPVTQRIEWCGPFAFASRYTPLLVAGNDLRNVSVTVDGTQRIAEVTATHGTDAFTVSRGEAATGGWKASTVVSAPSGSTALATKAIETLEAVANPVATITGGVPVEHWGIRERGYIRALIPFADFDGLTVSGRVLERTISDASPLMTIKAQVVGSQNALPQLALINRNRGDVRTTNIVNLSVNITRTVEATRNLTRDLDRIVKELVEGGNP
jgi:hypothetical protein